MAPRLRLPALLAFLSLAAATLSPAGVAQDSNTSSGAIVLGTGAAAYPPGGTVLFTLQNKGSWNATVGEMRIFAGAALVGTFTPAAAPLTPGAGASFDWKAVVDGRPAPQGGYWGYVRITEQRTICGNTGNCYVYPTPYSLWVNGKNQSSPDPGWLIQEAASVAPAPAARLAVAVTAGAVLAGQRVNVTLTNTGSANLTAAPCDIGFSVRTREGGAEVFNTVQPGQSCIQIAQVLAPGASLDLAWDTAAAKPGAYLLRGQYGATFSGDAEVAITAPTSPPTPPPAALTLTGPRESVPPGVALQFTLTNTGGTALEGTLGAEVRDATGAVVWTLVTAQVVQRLEPGKSLAFTWDQRLDGGAEAAAGRYAVIASFGGLQARADVELQGRSGSSPPPPTTAPPPPAEAKPVVGRIDLDASAGASGQSCYKGDWVSLCVDAGGRVLYDFQAGGKLMVRRMALPGSGAIVVSAEPGAIVLRSAGAIVTVYDSPAGSLRLEAPGAAGSVQLELGEGLAATASTDGATLRGPGYEALLLVQGQGEVTTPAHQLVVVGLDADSAGEAGFVLRAKPAEAPASAPAPQVTLTDGALVKAALDAALPQAIAAQKVAAEAYIAREGGEVKTSVVPYVQADVHIVVSAAQPDKLSLTLDVAQPHGRTLVFHLGPDVLVGTRAGFRVLYDGQPIALASSLADVLDADDDGLAAEYVLVEASGGVDLVVSVPHFSVHTLSVESLAKVVPSLAPYGAAAGFAVMLAAAVYMFRRSR